MAECKRLEMGRFMDRILAGDIVVAESATSIYRVTFTTRIFSKRGTRFANQHVLRDKWIVYKLIHIYSDREFISKILFVIFLN